MRPTIVCRMALAIPRPASGVTPEVADHRGVGEQEDGFGDERAECGNGQTEDLAVDPLLPDVALHRLNATVRG